MRTFNNKTFKQKVLCFAVLFVFVLPAQKLVAQQDYGSAGGVRLSPSSGITFKHFIKNDQSLEYLLTTRWGGLSFTGMFQLNQVAFGTEKLNFYYGLGGHVGMWNGEKDTPWLETEELKLIVGPDAIIGIEFTFESIPFNISLDWKPSFNIAYYTSFWVDDVAFSVRYTFQRNDIPAN